MDEKRKHKVYQLIDDEETRKKIVDLYFKDHLNIKQISSQTNVKQSTCKAIINVYESEGRTKKKKTRSRKLMYFNMMLVLDRNT